MVIEYCPRCHRLVRESLPAEPDVGIMVPLLECSNCGECFIDLSGEWHFLQDTEALKLSRNEA